MIDDKVVYRIFLSSPGDVNFERHIVRQEVQKILDEPNFASLFDYEIVSWDDPDSPSPLLANQTPQSTLRRRLVEPADCDLVIVIFWARMGTPLPKGQFQKTNGDPYYSGTEWEFESALNSPSKPNILLYRRIDQINLDPDSAEYDSSLQQQGLVNQFFKRFGMKDGALKGLYQKYKGTSGFRQQFRQDLLGILKLDIAEGATSAEGLRDIKHKPILNINPYVGLSSYDEKHADVFFGRERDIQRLEEKVANKASCIAVVGSSGAGKSSLVLAGLIPKLKISTTLGGEQYISKTTKPSNINFLSEFSEATTQQDINESVEKLLADFPTTGRFLMVVDQAEELLKLDKDTTPKLVMILNCLIQCPRVSLILTCRTDLYGDFVEISGTELQSYLQENTFMLSAPRATDMIDIIRKPAQAAGIIVEDAVVGKILEKFEGNGGSLPLISYLLEKLYDTLGDNQLFNLHAYNSAGGVEGVVMASAEKVYIGLTPKESATFSDVFSRLLSIDKYDRVTRTHCALSVFQQGLEMENLISAFVKARLLTITEDDAGISRIEIAHESLIYNWPSLASLALERSSQIKWRQTLTEGAIRWKDGGKSDARLIQGEDLDKAIQVLADSDIKLEPEEKEFIEACKIRRLNLESKIRRVGFFPIGILVLSFLTVFYVTAQTYYDVMNEMARQQSSIAQDFATTFGLLITQPLKDGDLAVADTILNASFDRGYYEFIKVTGLEGKTIISRESPPNNIWRHSLISIPQSDAGHAELNAGWTTLGRVSVKMHSFPILALLDQAFKLYLIIIGIFLVIFAPAYLFSLKAMRQLRKSVS